MGKTTAGLCEIKAIVSKTPRSYVMTLSRLIIVHDNKNITNVFFYNNRGEISICLPRYFGEFKNTGMPPCLFFHMTECSPVKPQSRLDF